MKTIIVVLASLLLLSCNKNDYKESNFENIDVYNEVEINHFMKSFLNNLNPGNDSFPEINYAKFCGNKLSTNEILLKPEKWLISKTKLDSLFTDEDLSYIIQQVNDQKKYIVFKETVPQKILDSDSLRKQNFEFNDLQEKKLDSLIKISTEKAKKYIQEEGQTERYYYSKNSSPIIYFDKPVFLKNKNKVIFSHYYYAGFLSARQETALYEFKKGKWFKIVILKASIS